MTPAMHKTLKCLRAELPRHSSNMDSFPHRIVYLFVAAALAWPLPWVRRHVSEAELRMSTCRGNLSAILFLYVVWDVACHYRNVS